MSRRQKLTVGVAVALVVLAVAALVGYERAKLGYDAYRARIQPGIEVVGVDVGGKTPEEARNLVAEQIAQPYYRSLTLFYQEQQIALSPARDLALHVDVGAMVTQALEASHQTDYWQGFKEWLRGEALTKTLDVPLMMTFDPEAAAGFLAQAADQYDRGATEPMVDVQKLTFIPGRSGHRLEVDQAVALVNEVAANPQEREVVLPVTTVEPDQSPARIESMLSTLGPVMDVAPTAPSFYTATLALSSTGGLTGTPLVTYTGELTWTFPYFSEYEGPLTSTYGYFFDPGKAGARFDVGAAIAQVNAALEADESEAIQFEATPVPPPTITAELLRGPLEARLARFPGVYSLLVKNLDTGEVVYDRNTRAVLSGMSVVKIGIMVEVYRAAKGAPDEQTRRELTDMLGSSSCNPCANRLMAAVGDGSATAGAQRVTSTMQRLGLTKFRLCGPYRLQVSTEGRGEGGRLLADSRGLTSCTAPPASSVWFRPLSTAAPGYDGCVHATPREMADLLEMMYSCTQGKGTLQQVYPSIFTRPVCQEMIDIMASNDLRNMLGAGIPAEVKLAHKHGFAGYDAPWGDTRAEVGIVFSPGATYLVSYYIWEDSPWIDFGVVQPLYRDVSNMLYNYFNVDEPYWALPPWAPWPSESVAPSIVTS